MSAMLETMETQPSELRRLLGDTGPVERAAEVLRGRRIVIAGTGTSWHAANHGVWFMWEAGIDARAAQAMDTALFGHGPRGDEALILLSHRGTKMYTSDTVTAARAAGIPIVQISAARVEAADIHTVEPERSSAFTASHLGAMLRLCQLASLLGKAPGDLDAVPEAVAEVLGRRPLGIAPPARLAEYTGAGPNQWTAAEGALKARETCYVATQGLSVEQLLHGPSVALQAGDALISLDGGGPGASRLAEIEALCAAYGVAVHAFRETALGEPLSVFALTTVVQLLALEWAEALGTNPDSFGRDLPGRGDALAKVRL
jgi:glucosamine--fructose-6-phosphate aminotransferase (isomerizing)